MGDVSKSEFFPVLEDLWKLKDRDAAHDELGVANGFHEFDEKKKEICMYFEGIIDRTFLCLDEINEIYLNEFVQVAESLVKQINTWVDQIDALVEEGVHNNQYPNKRERLISSIVSKTEAIKKNLRGYEQELRISELQKTISNSDLGDAEKVRIEEEFKKIDSFYEEAKKSADEANKVLEAAKGRTIEKGIDDSVGNFENLHNHHKEYEKWWFISVTISAALLAASVLYAVGLNVDISDIDQAVVSILKRVILISVPAVFLRICLSKYNAERNLRILYAHRGKVLEQYAVFEAGIGNDVEAKNQFRLEIAKYIFSDPKSNYSSEKERGGYDVNINPIVSVAEKMVGK